MLKRPPRYTNQLTREFFHLGSGRPAHQIALSTALKMKSIGTVDSELLPDVGAEISLGAARPTMQTAIINAFGVKIKALIQEVTANISEHTIPR